MYYKKTIEQVISPKLLTCPPDTSLRAAAAMMEEARCGSIVVMEPSGNAVGIWTEADALDIDFSDPSIFDRPVSEVMSAPVRSLPVDTTFSEAAILFKKHRVRHYLVTGEDGAIRGLLSQTDIVLNQGAEFFLKLKDLGSILDGHMPTSLSHSVPFGEAVKEMRRQKLEALVINYPDGGLGILTQRDVVRHLDSRDALLSVGQLASRPLITAKVSASLYYARKLLAEKHIRHLGITSETGELVGLVGFSDILTSIEHEYVNELHYALKERDEALNVSQQNLQLADKVFESTLEGIIITDANGIVEMVNPAFTRITGYRKEEVIGRNPRILNAGVQSAEFYQHMWQGLREHGFWQGEVINRRKDGKLYTEHLTITSIRDSEGNFTHYAGIFTDITQRKLNEERLHYLANHDSLTGLPNRTLFMERLTAAIAHAHRNSTKVALMFIDLDRFKFVNDTLGHGIGDKLLQSVALRLTGNLRDCDTVARLGGDEFTVIVENIAGVRSVAQVAQKLIASLIGMVNLDGHDVYVTGSIGIAIYPDDGLDPRSLLMNADTAMYRAKERGKNNFQFFTADMNAETRTRMRLESNLHRALERQEMCLHYQPKYNLRTGQINGMEALLRWNNEELGMVSPTQFIPIAEESSIIVELGKWVLHTACEQAREWLNQGLLPGPIAVNLSSRQIKLSNMVETVREALESSNLPAHMLELEITETVAMDNTQDIVRTLASLKGLGVRLAIDDFGTGYSSLSYLKRLPIDVLKIDRSFVEDLHIDHDDAAITSAIISMAKSLNLEPIAEGIENEAQLKFLREQGCFGGQGFLFSKPLSRDDMDSLLVESLALSALV